MRANGAELAVRHDRDVHGQRLADGGRCPSAKCTPMALAVLPADTAATMSAGRLAILGGRPAWAGRRRPPSAPAARRHTRASMQAAGRATASATARQLLMIIRRPSAANTNRRMIARPLIAKGWVDRPWPTAARTDRRCAAPRSARRRTREKRAETPDRASGWRSTTRGAGCAGCASASTSVSSAKSNSPNNS